MLKSGEQKDASWSALSLAWELGYIIAVPLVILALAGRFLDKKFNTSPFLLLAGILLSILVSSLGIIRKTMRIMGEMEGVLKNKEQETRNKACPFDKLRAGSERSRREQGTNSLVTLGQAGINHKHQITPACRQGRNSK